MKKKKKIWQWFQVTMRSGWGLGVQGWSRVDPVGHGFSAHLVSLEVTKGPKKRVVAAEWDFQSTRSGALGSHRGTGCQNWGLFQERYWRPCPRILSPGTHLWHLPALQSKLWIPSEEIFPSDHKATEPFYLNPSLLKEKYVHFLNMLPRTMSRTSVSHSSNW